MLSALDRPGPREAETEARAINLAMDVRNAASEEEALELVKGKKGVWDDLLEQKGGEDIAVTAVREARSAPDDIAAARILREKLSGVRGNIWDRLLDLQNARDLPDDPEVKPKE